MDNLKIFFLILFLAGCVLFQPTSVAAGSLIYPPMVFITSPAANSIISGTINVATQINDSKAVASKVWFRAYGETTWTPTETDTTRPFGFSWDTTKHPDGPYRLYVQSFSDAGDVSVYEHFVYVQNLPDTVSPSVTITSPAEGATVAGMVGVYDRATDNSGLVTKNELLVDDLLVQSVTPVLLPISQTQMAYLATFTWNSGGYANGPHKLTVKVYDSAGNSASQSINVVLSNPPPLFQTFFALSSSINAGQSTKLSWSAVYAASCSASEGWSGEKNVFGTETVTPLDTTTYTLTCTSANGSASQSVTVTVTGSSTSISNLTFRPQLQGRTDLTGVSFTIQIFASGQTTELAKFTVTGGTASLPSTVTLTPGTYDIRSASPYYLSQKTSLSLASSQTFTLPTLLAGDLSNDNIINSLDWSLMSPKWFTSDPIADLNKDGSVNSIDFSLLNRNWGKSGG